MNYIYEMIYRVVLRHVDSVQLIQRQQQQLDRQMNNGNHLVPQGHYLIVDTNIVLQQVEMRNVKRGNRSFEVLV